MSTATQTASAASKKLRLASEVFAKPEEFGFRVAEFSKDFDGRDCKVYVKADWSYHGWEVGLVCRAIGPRKGEVIGKLLPDTFARLAARPTFRKAAAAVVDRVPQVESVDELFAMLDELEREFKRFGGCGADRAILYRARVVVGKRIDEFKAKMMAEGTW